MRRNLLIALSTLLAIPGVAWSQVRLTDNKPIRIIVPFGAGGPVDVLARRVAEKLADMNKVTVIVENKAGGNTLIGASEVARAPADGHTLLITTPLTHTQAPHLYKKLPYRPLQDFTALASLSVTPMVLQVTQSVPARDIAELVKYANANPDKLNFANPGQGSVPHLFGEELGRKTGIHFNRIAYKGAAAATSDLLAGLTHLSFDFPSTAKSREDTGKVRILGVTGHTRTPLLPEVATLEEQGLKGFTGQVWVGVFGPAGMPAATRELLSSQFVAIAQSPEIAGSIVKDGAHVMALGSEEFGALVRRDHALWGEMITSSGITLQ